MWIVTGCERRQKCFQQLVVVGLVPNLLNALITPGNLFSNFLLNLLGGLGRPLLLDMLVFLGTFVLSGLLAGLLRAQIMPYYEAFLFIYWPVCTVMVIFLAIGTVAPERADRTWEFLLALPISRAEILVAKWAWGLYQWIAMVVIATLAGGLALWSRHQGPVWIAMSLFALITLTSLASWYTLLFLLLTRARNEFTAAIGGLLLTVAVP